MGAVDSIREIITELTTSGLSKEVISLYEKKLFLLTEQVSLLEHKITDLQRENAELRKKLDDLQPVGLVENMGVLWKRDGDGFEKFPYCRECESHPIMVPQPAFGMWFCPDGHTFPLGVSAPR